MSETNVDSGSHLQSWKDGATRSAIIAFVERVSTEGSPDYVEPAARIATFDNDGTLWCEKPVPVEVGFILRRLAEMATKDESLRTKQPWQAAYEKDYAWLRGAIDKHYQGDDSDARVFLGGVLQAFGGLTVEEYQEMAAAFFASASHPLLKRPYVSTAYAPMVELLRYLEANGFTTYIASGGNRDFMRLITDEAYSIPPERVIGSSNALRYQSSGGVGTVAYLAESEVFDDGPVKPVRIWSRTGRRPIFAGGNSNGDIPMLEYVADPSRPSFSLLVNHDDSEREDPAYATGAEKALELAAARGWTVVSVKDDWSRIF